MRVLLLSHLFLPKHPAGTEIHTAELALDLRELGVQVELFTTEKDIGRRDRSLTRRTWNGLVVHELVNNLFYENFRQTWDWPPAAEAFGRVLDEFQPDVLHVMHLIYLSVGCVEEARRRGIPVVFTLHDFWLTCPRFGQLLHADGSLCERVEFHRCGTCIAATKYAQSPLERRMARAVASIHTVTGVDLSDTMIRARRGVLRRADRPKSTRAKESTSSSPPRAYAEEMARAAQVRSEEMLRRLVPTVSRFFAPSHFLRERFVDWGIPPERIEYLPNGIHLAEFEGVPRPARDPAAARRVAFVGTLAPHKAPHLVLEAWGRLAPEVRAAGELVLHGPHTHNAEYVAQLEVRAREVGARLADKLEREEVPRFLAGTDLLVVPSVWYENAPLTLLEARAARTPVLASHLGGMGELVIEGHTGWRFPAGDVGALAQHLTRVLTDPGSLDALDFVAPAVVSTRAAAEALLRRYRELATASSDGGDRG